MNVAQMKGVGAKAEVANNVLMNDGDRSSGESSPFNVPTITLRASSPTSITLNASMAAHSLSDPSSLQSSDTLALAALYQSSRRSRENSPEKKNQQLLPYAPDLLPSPPIYYDVGKDNGQSIQSDKKNSAQSALISTITNTMNNSWNSLAKSSLKSSISTTMASNPPMTNTNQIQQRDHCTTKKQGNIDWSTLNNYSMEEKEEPSCPIGPALEGDGDSSSALDDSEYPHVRRRSDFEFDTNCHEDQEKSSSPGELPIPPHKKNRRGSLRMSMDESSNEPTKLQVPANDNPTIPLPCSSDTAFDIYVPNNANKSSKTSSTSDDNINLSRSRRRGELSRRNSLRLEDLEDEQESMEERENELVRRKIQRLLLIRHCTKCTIRKPNVKTIDTGYFCPVTSRCAEGKALCAHIKTCKLDNCTYKKCLTTREVLGHYINCKDRGCKICGPVRTRDKKSRNQMKDDIEWRHANMLL